MKKFLKGLLIVVILLVGIAFVLPSTSYVERSKVIDADASEVFDVVADLTTWQQWTSWSQNDTTMQVTYHLDDPEKPYYTWTSEQEDDGKLTITGLYPNDSILTYLEISDWNPSQGKWTFEAQEAGTKVTWSMTADLGYNPISRWMGLLFFDGWLGDDFEKGLAGLDTYIEEMPDPVTYSVDIQTETLDAPTYYLGIKDTVVSNGDSISAMYGMIFGTIGGYMATENLQMAGMPIAIQHRYDENDYIFTAALPVAKPINAPEGMVSGSTYTGKVVTAVHVGDYHQLGDTHQEAMRYMENNGLKANGDPWEVYVDDPGSVPMEEVRTMVYYPVK